MTSFSRFWQGMGQLMATWSSRRDLEALDDRMLKDLGLSRAQAAFEASRAPWELRGTERR